MEWTSKDREALRQLREDPRKVYVMCEEHMYAGGAPGPKLRCANCWRAYYFLLYSNAPEGDRKELLEGMEEMVAYMTEAVDQGKFDIKLDEHPTFEIEKDVN